MLDEIWNALIRLFILVLASGPAVAMVSDWPDPVSDGRAPLPFDPDGHVTAIVAFNHPMPPDETILERLDPSGAGQSSSSAHAFLIRRFRHVPAAVVHGTIAQIEGLAEAGIVRSIHYERIGQDQVLSSVPITGAPDLWTNGIVGTGESIAILGSGVDQSHPAFAGRIVDSACFGTPIPGFEGNYVSFCANGQTVDTISENAGDASFCAGTTSCEHETGVASVAAGAFQLGGVQYDGMARGAGIVVVQVRAGYEGAVCANGERCRTWSVADTITALEWLYDHRDRLNLAAVNMSYGWLESAYISTGYCDHPMNVITSMLWDAGIPVVGGAGNEATRFSTLPACLPSVVMVGATNNQDQMASFSNNLAIVDLLAPGDGIQVAAASFLQLGSIVREARGVSVAIPHVSGAFALLRDAHPRASSEQMIRALQQTGQRVFDPRLDQNGVLFGFSHPRISVADASAALGITLENGPRLAAAILPAMRAVSHDGAAFSAATGFATLVNASGNAASACGLVAPAGFNGAFSFTRTDPETNDVIGTENQPVDIPAGQSRTFVFSMQPATAITDTEFAINFECDGDFAAPSIRGVNRFRLSASNTPGPDIASVAASTTADGVLRGQVGSWAAFATAAVNVGAPGTVVASVRLEGIPAGVETQICLSDPATAQCMSQRTTTATASIATQGVQTYSVFVRSDQPISLMPAHARVNVDFADASDSVRGSTSVAIAIQD